MDNFSDSLISRSPTRLMYPNTWQNLFTVFLVSSTVLGALIVGDLLRQKERER